MVICPGVVVVMVTLDPATRLVGAYLVPVLSAASSWPWMVGVVEVPVPPLETGKTPVTFDVKSMVPLVMSEFTIREEESKPEELLWTMPAVLKAVMVGAWATVKLEMEVVARVEVPVTEKLPLTVNPAKAGEAEVLTSWLMLEAPETVKVLVPKVKVPVPAVMVLPFKVLTVKAVTVVVARVEVPVTARVPFKVRLVKVGEATTATVLV